MCNDNGPKNSTQNNSLKKLPNCNLKINQFLSNVSDGHVNNPSLVINPKVKVYLDDKFICQTNPFFNMKLQPNQYERGKDCNLIFNDSIDFVVPSLMSILTFELFDCPMVKSVRLIDNDVESDSSIFISAVKLNIGYLKPGKSYHLILEFTGNLNPSIYEYGNILTNIKLNDISCSQCKVCNLFNYLTSKTTTQYYVHSVSSGMFVTSSQIDSKGSELEIIDNSCTCVTYSQVHDSAPCVACVTPCCSHKFSNYISIILLFERDILGIKELIKSPELIKSVNVKSPPSTIDSLLKLLQEGGQVYAKFHFALENALKITPYTFLKIIFFSICLFHGYILSILLLCLGILFVIFSTSSDMTNIKTIDYINSCSNCLNIDNKLSNTKYSDYYKSTTCIKCIHLKKFAEFTLLKNTMAFVDISFGKSIAFLMDQLPQFLLSVINVFNVFILLSQMHGKFFGLVCIILSWLVSQPSIIKSTLYKLSLITTIYFYSGLKFDFIKRVIDFMRLFFNYIAFICNRDEFNRKIYWL